ncbi:FG-GAP-like repeat-containing protein [Streptomyces coeruleoprunus]|uniref:FG-GAP-like repeat-containing protein n=1 Tax=Streptomyces coeruleoprunus TaxID=285563 RepID=A0ABV9XK69_9ACTN
MRDAPSQANFTPAASTSTDPVATGAMSEEDKALQDAAATGRPVELVSARTESSDTWAMPDGSFSVKRHGTAVRLWRDGAWVAADPTLVFAADGSVVPKASAVSTKFSGGGTGPMLSGIKDGRTLTLNWPKALPTPTLAGNVATYAEVLPGVDLQLKAEVEGFSQLLVVKTAEAAKNPELNQLQFDMDTVGLNVSKDADTGTLVATDPAGQTVFTSPAPLMWDSSTISSASAATTARTLSATSTTESSPGDVFEPGPGAMDAQMQATVSGDILTITPDQSLLNGADTTYPVYIDPSWAWGEWQHWARVYKAYPNTSFWDAKEIVRVGYEAETGGSDRISRSFFQMDTRDVRGAQVKSATFRIRNTWSWSCQARPVELWEVTDISKKTTWNNQPSRVGLAPLSTVNESKGWSSQDCAAGNLEFDATAAVRKAAANNEPGITLGLYASNEGDTYGWKKFDPKTATLEISYNHPPETPTGLGTNPRTSCSVGGTIGNTSVSIHAKIDDPDGGNLTAHFQAFKAGTTTPAVDTTVPALKGRIATVVLPSASTPSGDYTWRVRAKDADGVYSAWSSTCKFRLDRARPSLPPVISSVTFPSGDKGWPNPTGAARSEGEFTFTPNGVNDVVSYHWWTDTDPEGGDATAEYPKAFVTPPSYGPHLLHAYSVDRAGNRSDTATYLYYATRAQLRDKPGDLNGDGYKDIWSTDTNGTLLTYAGRGNREFSSAANGGGSFPGQQVTFSGDWHQDGYNDLISLEYNANEQKNQLRVYRNNGRGLIDQENPLLLRVSCPVPELESDCMGEPGWTGDDHWYNAEQVATGGDINRDRQPEVLVKQGKHLWVYYGARSGWLDQKRPPILVGETDWDQFTLILPGDLNGDELQDLLLRHNASGDLYRAYGRPDPNGGLDTATWGRASDRVKIATGTMPQSLFPLVGSSGDLDGDGNGDGVKDGDGIPDLWARKSDNTLIGWPGRKTGVDFTGIGAYFPVDGINGGRHIPAGATLTAGQSLSSASATLTMQTDGNLVVRSNAGKVLWSTLTGGNTGATARVLSNGNLAVYSADGSKQLWSSGVLVDADEVAPNVKPGLPGIGYVVLQDRGNLVVHNGKGQAVWASGTVTRHDHNRDGRSDIGLWYDFSAGTDATYTLTTNSDGSFNAPMKSFAALAGAWEAKSMKFVTGDFNGDGHGDMAALYGYSDTSIKLWTALGQPDGGFGIPFSSWSVPKNTMHTSYMTPHAGDFNGDGRDDIAVWYAYPDGTSKLLTFTAGVKGGFNEPFDSWSAPSGTWLRSRSKFVTGDFNGDGRDDLSVFYGQGDDSVRTYVFLSDVSGGFANPTSWWYSDAIDWDLTSPLAGDVNGDRYDDAMIWYDYGDGSDKVSTMLLRSQTSSFGSAFVSLAANSGVIDIKRTQLVVGDYNGDGRDDLGAMHHQSDDSVLMRTWTARPDGMFDGALESWSAPATSWVYASTRIFKAHN